MFSILIPSWNNLAYLKLCVDSIRRHSSVEHEIIVLVNDGSDGTLAWVREQGLALTLGFMAFGLTVETFDLTMNAALYALSSAVLLAATLRPTHEP